MIPKVDITKDYYKCPGCDAVTAKLVGPAQDTNGISPYQNYGIKCEQEQCGWHEPLESDEIVWILQLAFDVDSPAALLERAIAVAQHIKE